MGLVDVAQMAVALEEMTRLNIVEGFQIAQTDRVSGPVRPKFALSAVSHGFYYGLGGKFFHKLAEAMRIFRGGWMGVKAHNMQGVVPEFGHCLNHLTIAGIGV